MRKTAKRKNNAFNYQYRFCKQQQQQQPKTKQFFTEQQTEKLRLCQTNEQQSFCLTNC